MTPEQFKAYLASLDPDSRLRVAEGMWQHIEAQQPGWEELSNLMSDVNVTDFYDVDSQGGGILDAMDMAFSLGPNLMSAGVNAVRGADQEFDPHRSYATALVDQGMPWGAAGALGTLLDFLEPGPGGEVKAAAKGVGMAAAGIGPFLRGLLREGGEDAIFRMEHSLTGRGPFQAVDTPGMARGGTEMAQYWADSPRYLQDSIDDIDFVARTGRIARPQWDEWNGLVATVAPDARVIDITGGSPDSGLWNAMTQQLLEHPGLTDSQRELVARNISQVQSGELQPWEVIKDAQRFLGSDLGGTPHRAGVDVIRQFKDDNTGVNAALRGGWLNELPHEYVVTNPRGINVQLAMDLLDLLDQLRK